MRKPALIASILIATLYPSHAQTVTPTEAEKVAALKKAYELNGNSMVRWGSIDLTSDNPTDELRFIDPTIRVEPEPAPVAQVPAEKLARQASNGICSRHGMRKVDSGNGHWRCRK